MTEKDDNRKQAGKKPAAGGAAKPKKPAAKKSAAKKGKKPAEAEKAEGKTTAGEEIEDAPEEQKGAVPDIGEEERPVPPQEEKEMSEEDFERLVEESLEKVTVAEIVLTMMNQLASIGYLKMGIPENVNIKYRDFEQARLAIDTLEAMLKGAEGKVAEDYLRPFQGTLANLQMNFVQLRRKP
jgi:hypothetical protein